MTMIKALRDMGEEKFIEVWEQFRDDTAMYSHESDAAVAEAINTLFLNESPIKVNASTVHMYRSELNKVACRRPTRRRRSGDSGGDPRPEAEVTTQPVTEQAAFMTPSMLGGFISLIESGTIEIPATGILIRVVR